MPLLPAAVASLPHRPSSETLMAPRTPHARLGKDRGKDWTSTTPHPLFALFAQLTPESGICASSPAVVSFSKVDLDRTFDLK